MQRRLGRSAFGARSTGFNPHPARRPDATINAVLNVVDHHVSILIRPEGRMQPSPFHGRLFRAASNSVSILIRPEGRMQRPASICRLTVVSTPARTPATNTADCDLLLVCPCFNPHPARRPDATPSTASACARPTHVRGQFQSSSGQKAGCNVRRQRPGSCNGPKPVSILIRPEGRMQQPPKQLDERTGWYPHARRPDTAWWRTAFRGFQSSSGQKAGCNPVKQMTRAFQSASGQKAGCNTPKGHRRSSINCFNPHPARRPDATASTLVSQQDTLT